ncbi:hypothetical protein ASF26_09165 [Methylobacterium sp. Leaf93]|nr:hypothetical protein ASF26_09165 [Methylobacterium sp. Leaf93]
MEVEPQDAPLAIAKQVGSPVPRDCMAHFAAAERLKRGERPTLQVGQWVTPKDAEIEADELARLLTEDDAVAAGRCSPAGPPPRV